ncbi:hypothetical protein chiPu_0030757 [Chiloscyllium punctatum]|uniref:Uncharacterized protein n=1 Tax=Chiloscyllium punctatum TaxID=137246 RepID=A0A401TW90_CHIPU|nr:hypothetical protein [Chiloscyllium punctatum]
MQRDRDQQHEEVVRDKKADARDHAVEHEIHVRHTHQCRRAGQRLDERRDQRVLELVFCHCPTADWKNWTICAEPNTSTMPKMTLPAMPQVSRPDQAKNPQAMTARVANAVAIGPVSADTNCVKVD